MKLHLPDMAIIAAYLVTMVILGWSLRKKASLNKENYLMGGKGLRWYMLGLSDASDMFDISGTMWMVSLCPPINRKGDSMAGSTEKVRWSPVRPRASY